MLNNNILSTKNLHKYYADRILDITRNISVTPIVWQDVWDEKVEVAPPALALGERFSSCSNPVAGRNDHSSLEGFQRQQRVRLVGIVLESSGQRGLQRDPIEPVVHQLHQLRKVQHGRLGDESGILQVLRN